MHPQLTQLISQLDGTSYLAQRLLSDMVADQMRLRPEHDRWSVGECLEHLNLFSESLLRSSAPASLSARKQKLFASGPYKLDLMGRVANWMMQPAAIVKMRAAEDFHPELNGSVEEVLPRFLALQQQLKTEIANVDGLDLNKILVSSPFSRRRQYNLYSCYVMLVTHQERHLRQAAQAKREIH